MLSKESKIRVLEGFYGIDYTIFGKPVSKVETCCPILKEEYLSIKGALLSVYIEMIKLIEHSPKVVEEKIDSTILLKKSKSSARIARENAQKIVVSKKSRNAIKLSLKEDLKNGENTDLSKVVESKIREKAFSLAVDNLLLVPVLKEAKSYQKLNDWEGRIIEDSYKILRDNLVEGAIQILYDDDDLFTEEDKMAKAGAKKESKEISNEEIKVLEGTISNLQVKRYGILIKQAKFVHDTLCNKRKTPELVAKCKEKIGAQITALKDKMAKAKAKAKAKK